MLKNSIGIDSYKDIVNNCYYVDKTMIIKEIDKMPPTSAILFTRPRRFGKSLTLNMLYSFFTKSESNEKYFINTKIYKEKDIINKHLNKYDVIYLNFKDIESKNKDELIYLTKQTIIKEIKNNHQDIFNLITRDKENLYNYIFDIETSDSKFTSCLKDLCDIIFKYTNKRPIILIDEYDKPLQSAYEYDYFQDISDFFKRLYSQTFKSNNNLEYGILTGVTKASKLSLFSGLNNINVESIVDYNYSKFFGFTEEETRNLLKNFDLEQKYDEVLTWYGGYNFGDSRIINPWSLLNFCKNQGRFKDYWSSTSSPTLINKIIKNNYINISNEINSLINDESIYFNIDESTNYLDINTSSNSLLTFLLFMGYFSIEKEFSNGYLLRFPNKEIKDIFSNELKSIFIGNNNMKLIYDLSNSFINGNNESFAKYLEQYILSTWSYFDFSNEKNYQIMLITMFTLIFDNCFVKSEVNAGDGRCDIMIQSKDPKLEFGAVIEVKCLKNKTSTERLNKSAIKALNQIIQHDYCQQLVINPNLKNVYAYGISFYKNHVETVNQKVK